MLTKSVGNPTLVLHLESIRVMNSLNYEEVPIEILDHWVYRLRTKDIVNRPTFEKNATGGPQIMEKS